LKIALVWMIYIFISITRNIIFYIFNKLIAFYLHSFDFIDLFVTNFVTLRETIFCAILNFLTHFLDAVNSGTLISCYALGAHRAISISWIGTPFSRFSWNFSNIYGEISFNFCNLVPSLLIYSFHLCNWRSDVTFRNLCFTVSNDFLLTESADFQNSTAFFYIQLKCHYLHISFLLHNMMLLVLHLHLRLLSY